MARVLVVDDDGLVLRATQRVLARAGHEVWESDNPKTALRMLEQVPVDVVVTDVYMPGMSGIELCRRLENRDTCRRVIAMTGGGSLSTPDKLLFQARMAGAERTLEKPFGPGDLIGAVDAVLQLETIGID